MTDFKDQDNQYFLLERTEDAVIAHAILSKMMELSLEALTNLARIFQFGHALQQELENSA